MPPTAQEENQQSERQSYQCGGKCKPLLTEKKPVPKKPARWVEEIVRTSVVATWVLLLIDEVAANTLSKEEMNGLSNMYLI